MRNEMSRWCVPVAMAMVLLCPNAYAAKQWVEGRIVRLEDYAGYSTHYGVLVDLADQVWVGVGDGETNCLHRFNLRVGVQGLTEESLGRIYAILLSSYLAGKRVALYVENGTANGYCDVQIGSVADVYQ